MNFSALCIRILQYKHHAPAQSFTNEVNKMDLRFQKAKAHLQLVVQQVPSYGNVPLGQDFEQFWAAKSHDVRVDMLEKTCEWIGLMKGSPWCGIKDWKHQGRLFLHLCNDLLLTPLLVLDIMRQQDAQLFKVTI